VKRKGPSGKQTKQGAKERAPDAADKQGKGPVFEPSPPQTYRCRICGESGASDESDGLCWVCRRLKISAWREVEQQMPLSE